MNVHYCSLTSCNNIQSARHMWKANVVQDLIDNILSILPVPQIQTISYVFFFSQALFLSLILPCLVGISFCACMEQLPLAWFLLED